MNKIKNHVKLDVWVICCFLITVLFMGSPLAGQENKGKNFSLVTEVQPVPEQLKTGFESITAKEAGKFLKFLSSDLLEGRETAGKGYEIAAEFAATMFSLWDIKPAGDFPVKVGHTDFFSHDDERKEEKKERSYFQEMEIKELLKADSQIGVEYQKGSQVKSRSFNPEIDYEFRASTAGTLSAPVVFAGYGIVEKGINYDDYGKLEVAGKIVMLLTGVPGKDNPNSPFNKEDLKQKYFPQRPDRHMASPQVKLAMEKGAVAVLLVESLLAEKADVPKEKLASRRLDDEKPVYPGERRRMSLVQGPPDPWETLPTVRVSRGMANEILGYAGQTVETLMAGIEKDFKPHSMALPGVDMKIETRLEEQLVKCRNVLGFIEGSDPQLKNEVVVIGAHLDHLGKRGDYIFNGADDNGSGSVAVMEAAHAFAVNPVKPKRSVLFALWTGEEKGLLGSRYYTLHPFFPLEKTVTYINLDMVSREWTMERLMTAAKRFGMDIPEGVDKVIDPAKFFSLQLSRTPGIMEALKENNRYVGLHIFFRESDRAGGGSDHASFGSQKIPWAAFFGAMTDDYHHASDSIEKVNLTLIEKAARLTWLSVFSLADRQK